MNFNCLTDKVTISLDSILNTVNYNLGTDIFYNSVYTITITCDSYVSMRKFEKAIEIIEESFSNLKYLNISTDKHMYSLSEIIQVLKNNKINQISSLGKNFHIDDTFSIVSKNGYALLYDNKEQCIVNYKSIKLDSNS